MPGLSEVERVRDMTKTGAQPVWAGHEFRLDPTRLPQQMCYASRSGAGEVNITVNKRGAVVKTELSKSGLPLNVALPNRVFKGVAARAVETGPENATVTLELLHDDENLCVPLRVGHDLAEIARDWQIWAELLHLPMILFDADGIPRTLDESAAAVEMKSPYPRRPTSVFADRRPRFLARRRMGDLGVRLMVSGEEIIARG